MQRCPVNPDKIKQLKYDTAFILPNTKFNEVLKGSSIATDSDKLYFYTKDDKVYCELNDLERQNINNITYLVAEKFVGENIKNTLPLNLENIRLLAGTKCNEFTVKINNELKVTLFQIEEKEKSVFFTEKGIENIESLLKKQKIIANDSSLYEPNNIALVHHLNQALKAHHLFKNETDYIVKDNSVIIIDEFTGRMQEGRRFSDGLHQALEAKERLKIRNENQTLAS
ncbi:hypothetical protein EBS02_09775, partial [bacterium]|nr:hypothetical protein [bacterium]